MRTDKQFLPAQQRRGRGASTSSWRDGYLAGMKAKLPEYFGILPEGRPGS